MLNTNDKITISITVDQCNAALPWLAKGPFFRVAGLMAAIQQAVHAASNGTAAVVPMPADGAQINGEMPDVSHRQ